MVQRLESDLARSALRLAQKPSGQFGPYVTLKDCQLADRRVTGVALHDYGCSLKVGRRDVLEGLDLRGEMHRFIPLWVANLTHPSRIAEIPVNHRARSAGTSKHGISRTPRVILWICSLHGFSSDSKSVLGIFLGSLVWSLVRLVG